jgi:nitrate/nitrite transporter NarK
VTTPHYPPIAVALGIWGLAAGLYVMAFFHRVVPAVITVELTEAFALSATALGHLSALYFYAYVPLQIPFGAAADAFGARRVLTVGGALATLGALQFALAETALAAGLGRLLIGAGVGVAFVCMLKLASHWFHPRRFAMLAGCALVCGVLGAVTAGAPVRWLADVFGWRAVVVSAAVVTALVAIATWWFVRDDPTARSYASYSGSLSPDTARHSLLGGIAVSFRSRNVCLILVVCSGVSGAPLTFAGLWGVPFLSTHYGFSTAGAAALASLVLVAWALPSPLLGLLSDRMGRRKPVFATGALLSLAAWSVIVLVPGLPRALLIGLLLVAGCAAACVMVGFAFAKESTPAALAGTTTGIVNMGNMLGGMLMQPAVGWILDRSWDGSIAAGARLYGFDAYRDGFSIMLAWLAFSLLLVSFTRETFCRQRP